MSSSHTHDQKNDFLVLGEGPTYEINGHFGSQKKKKKKKKKKSELTFVKLRKNNA